MIYYINQDTDFVMPTHMTFNKVTKYAFTLLTSIIPRHIATLILLN